jgi:glycogen(starch) synthase
MRVLMFGWEFPPQIAGGLGVACEGIAKALVQEGVSVTFVVPTLKGNEFIDGGKIVGADRIVLKRKRTGSRSTDGTSRIMNTKLHSAQLTEVQVPARLVAYNQASMNTPRWALEHWSGRLFEDRINTTVDGHAGSNKQTSVNKHSFVGGYGAELLAEVEKYAEVAEVLATQQQFDVIHAHDWMTLRAGVAAKKVSGKPLVVHMHATEFDRAGDTGSPEVYRLEREGLHFADRVICVSAWTQKAVVEKYHVDPRKTRVVHNGIDSDAWTSLPASRPPLGSHLVTFLGRLTFQKGPKYFIETAEKVLAHFPDCHFVMAGAGDAFIESIRMVAGKKMSARIHFTGFLSKPDIQRLLSMTSVYVMPSVSEPFGLTALEASTAGVPVVMSRQSGAAEVMPHALKVDYWDTDAMAVAICNILRSKTLSSALSNGGVNSAKAITWRQAARNIKSIYKEVIRLS